MISLPEPTTLLVGAMAFLRIGGILFAMPIIGDTPTPIRARVLLALAITIGLYSSIPASWAPNLDTDVVVIGLFVGKELIVGLMIGFMARIAFAGILMAAAIVSYQMGFGTSNLFLPDLNSQLDAFTAFHRAIMMLLFLVLGLHHMFLAAIHETFVMIPGGAFTIKQELGQFLIDISAGLFVTALQMAAPVLIALMFTMTGMGLIARTVPQMNVFILSFPASFFIGLAVYRATFRFYPDGMQEHFFQTQEYVITVIRGMAS